MSRTPSPDRSSLGAALLALTMACGATPEPPAPRPPGPRVLLIGIDGLQFDRLREVPTPNLDRLRTVRAFTGGLPGTATRQFTWSGPGWASIQTGTWLDRHGIPGNLKSYQLGAPTVFTLVRRARPDSVLAAVVNWSRIFEVQKEQLGALDEAESIDWEAGGDSIVRVSDTAIGLIRDRSPDVLFVMYVNVDEVGHAVGFGPEYDAAIEAVDAEVGRLLEAVQARADASGEDWLVIATADHGRKPPEGKQHGEMSTEEKTVFIKMNKSGNASFACLDDMPNRDDDGLYGCPSQTAVAPTILRHLGVAIEDGWGLGDSPLLGPEGPMRLGFADEAQTTLSWVSASTSDATVYRNGVKLAAVPADAGVFVDADATVAPDAQGHITYIVSIDGSTAYVSKTVP